MNPTLLLCVFYFVLTASLLLNIIDDTIQTSYLRYQSSNLYLFGANQLISNVFGTYCGENHTGKEVSKRDHVKNAQRSGGFHWLTTPENTDEVLRILSTIKLEYDLDAMDQKMEGCKVKGWLYLLRNPCKEKKIIFNKKVHAKILKLNLTFQAIPFP